MFPEPMLPRPSAVHAAWPFAKHSTAVRKVHELDEQTVYPFRLTVGTDSLALSKVAERNEPALAYPFFLSRREMEAVGRVDM